MTRRQFLVLTAAAVCSGLQTVGAASASPTVPGSRVVNAGPVSDYAAEGLYDRFRDQGFFVVRKGKDLFAVSAVCTHRQCKLAVGSPHSFACPCHGSTFDAGGRVTAGPAKRDLPLRPSVATANGQLLVTLPE